MTFLRKDDSLKDIFTKDPEKIGDNIHYHMNLRSTDTMHFMVFWAFSILKTVAFPDVTDDSIEDLKEVVDELTKSYEKFCTLSPQQNDYIDYLYVGLGVGVALEKINSFIGEDSLNSTINELKEKIHSQKEGLSKGGSYSPYRQHEEIILEQLELYKDRSNNLTQSKCCEILGKKIGQDIPVQSFSNWWQIYRDGGSIFKHSDSAE